MKTLILTRHANSEWASLQQKDYDRSLSSRGKQDAAMMGRRLLLRGVKPDLIVASTAKRAAETALLLAQELAYDATHIQWHDRLYHARPDVIMDVILELDNRFDVVLLVGHNNGITDFANQLAGGVTDHMPTCAMMGFDIDAGNWTAFALAPMRLRFYDYPKMGPH